MGVAMAVVVAVAIRRCCPGCRSSSREDKSCRGKLTGKSVPCEYAWGSSRLKRTVGVNII